MVSSLGRFLNWRLLLIFFLALSLRLIFLSAVPWGIHNDEADLGYIGKYLILNGHDPTGAVMPLSFNKYDDFRPIGLFYLSGVSQLIFGNNEFAIRLPTAFFGALTIFPLYLLVCLLYKNSLAGYFAGFFLAIFPWHIVLSRAAHEAVVGYFFVIFGAYFLLRFIGEKKRSFLIYALIVFLVSYLFYHGIRMIVPLALLGFLLISQAKQVKFFVLLFIILSTLIVLSPMGKGRLSQVVFYKDPAVADKIEQLPFSDVNSVVTARIFHNKGVVYSRALAKNYAQYISPNFLFFEGGFPERYKVDEVGVSYLMIGLLAFFGFVSSLRDRKKLLVIFWLFISTIPAVLTYEDIPSVTRASFLIFPLIILSALGASNVLKAKIGYRVKQILVGFMFLVLIAETVFFSHQYFVHQKFNKGILRDEGVKEMVRYVEEQKKNYDLVAVTHGPNNPLYYLLLGGYFGGDITFKINDKTSEFRHGNVFFVRDWCPSQRDHRFSGSVLYINEPGCDPRPGRHVIFDINRVDLTKAFEAVVIEN